MGIDWNNWPTLPEGIEGVILMHSTLEQLEVDQDATCFECGEPMPDAEENAYCWFVPGRGLAHDGCYEPEIDEEPPVPGN
jgi:hypothetical protein